MHSVKKVVLFRKQHTEGTERVPRVQVGLRGFATVPRVSMREQSEQVAPERRRKESEDRLNKN